MKFRKSSEAAKDMTLVEHLAELRARIVKSLLAVVVFAISITVFYNPVLRFLTRPYRDVCSNNAEFECDGSLYGLGPLDGLGARFRIAAYGGIIVALPVILWQVWRFIVPALHKSEKRYARWFLVAAVFLFSLGSAIAYWTLSRALEFLISWSGEDVSQTYQIGKYISLVAMMMLAFGFGLLFPLLLVFLQVANVLTPKTLIAQWRYAIMAIFVLAAVITPSGDPVSLFALSIPMTVLYLISVLIGLLIQRSRRRASLKAHGS